MKERKRPCLTAALHETFFYYCVDFNFALYSAWKLAETDAKKENASNIYLATHFPLTL